MALAEVIQTSNLTRKFHKITAVDHVTLQVPQGSIYGFLGPNGAGKTTTIRLLLRLIRPNEGTVRIFGLSLAQQRQAILQKVGAFVELPSLYPHLTGYENLDITRRLLGADRQKINDVLKIVRLENDSKRLVRGYSLGMRQRLALALALLGDPELLILDEPTNGLDPAGIQEIRALIRHLATERGITVFISSHLLNEVEQIATHVGIVLKGKLIFQGTLKQLQAESEAFIQIKTDQAEAAFQLLTNNGFTAHLFSNDEIRITNDPQINPSIVTKLLVQNQIEVSQINKINPSLEEIFMRLTSEKGDRT